MSSSRAPASGAPIIHTPPCRLYRLHFTTRQTLHKLAPALFSPLFPHPHCYPLPSCRTPGCPRLIPTTYWTTMKIQQLLRTVRSSFLTTVRLEVQYGVSLY